MTKCPPTLIVAHEVTPTHRHRHPAPYCHSERSRGISNPQSHPHPPTIRRPPTPTTTQPARPPGRHPPSPSTPGASCRIHPAVSKHPSCSDERPPHPCLRPMPNHPPRTRTSIPPNPPRRRPAPTRHRHAPRACNAAAICHSERSRGISNPQTHPKHPAIRRPPTPITTQPARPPGRRPPGPSTPGATCRMNPAVSKHPPCSLETPTRAA